MNINKLSRTYYRIKTRLGKFEYVGSNAVIFAPLQIEYARSIRIGDNSFISEGAWLHGNENNLVSIVVGNNVTVGHFAHIVAKSKVAIEDDVLIADKVFITDCTHEYKDIDKPIRKQEIKNIGQVKIGCGSWIGENVVIIGAAIGKHCIVGANTVVTKDVPDYCVVAGNPARILRRYNKCRNEWERMRN